MRSKFLKLSNARSFENGIVFLSRRHFGYLSLSSIDDNGNIETKWTNKNNMPQIELNKKPDKIFDFVIFPLILLVTIIVVKNLHQNPIFALRSYLIGEVIITLLSFLAGNLSIKTTKNRTKMFHSAEHMVINAYTKLKRIPSLEEARNSSRFHNYCGTNNTTVIVLDNFFIFLCTFLPTKKYIVIGILSIVIIIQLLKRLGLLNIMQIFTTSPPTDMELLVGIEGLKTWLENEEKPRNSFKE